jgi:hypothetical protein
MCNKIPWFQRLFAKRNLCKAKETRGEKEEPLVISVANPTSTLD